MRRRMWKSATPSTCWSSALEVREFVERLPGPREPDSRLAGLQRPAAQGRGDRSRLDHRGAAEGGEPDRARPGAGGADRRRRHADAGADELHDPRLPGAGDAAVPGRRRRRLLAGLDDPRRGSCGGFARNSSSNPRCKRERLASWYLDFELLSSRAPRRVRPAAPPSSPACAATCAFTIASAAPPRRRRPRDTPRWPRPAPSGCPASTPGCRRWPRRGTRARTRRSRCTLRGGCRGWWSSSNSGSSFRGWMQSTGQTSTQAASLVPMQGSVMTNGIPLSLHKKRLAALPDDHQRLKLRPAGCTGSAGHRRHDEELIPAAHAVPDGGTVAVDLA